LYQESGSKRRKSSGVEKQKGKRKKDKEISCAKETFSDLFLEGELPLMGGKRRKRRSYFQNPSLKVGEFFRRKKNLMGEKRRKKVAVFPPPREVNIASGGQDPHSEIGESLFCP